MINPKETSMVQILVIDNKSDHYSSLNAMILDAFPGADILTANTGLKGIEIAIEKYPDIIFLDMVMSDMDGFEVCHQLKQDETVMDIPVVFLTALNVDRDNRIKALEAGAVGFLTSPFDETELKVHISAIIKIKAANKIRRDENVRLNQMLAERTHKLEESRKETLKLINDLNIENEALKKNKEALKVSEAQFRNFFENAADAIFIADIESKIIVDANKAACRLLMMPLYEIVGLHHARLHPDDETENILEVFNDDVERIARGFKALPIEKQIVRSDGKKIPVEILASRVTFNGKQCMLGTFRDLTGRENAEDALIESQQLFRNLTQISPVGIFRTRADGYTTYVNPRWSELSGISSEDAIGDGWIRAVHPDDRESLLEGWNEDVKKKIQSVSEYRFLKPDGSIVWVMGNAAPEIEDGEVAGYIGTITDITERKIAEEALRDSRREFQHYFDSASVGMSVTLPDKTWIEVNQCLCDMLGYTRDELTGLPWDKISFPDDLPENTALFQQALEGKIDHYELDKRFIRKDGEIVYITLSVVCQRNEDGSVRHFLSSYINITGRKKAEETLLKAENHFRALIEKAPDGVALINAEGEFSFISPSAKKMFGHAPDDSIFNNPADHTHPDDLDMVHSELEKIIQDPTYIPTLQYRFISKDGTWKWIESTFSNLLSNPEIEAIVINFRDINDRKEYEELVKHERMMLRTLIDNLPDPVYILDKGGRKVVANKADVENIGCRTEAEALGKTDLDLFAGKIGKRGYADNMSVIKSGNPIIKREEKFVDKNGIQRWLLTSKFPLYDTSGQITGLVGIGYDITERKRVEDALKESEATYRTLVEKMPDGIYKSTSEGKFEEVNPAMVKMLGYNSKEELLAIDIKTRLYFDPSDRDSLTLDEIKGGIGVFRLKTKDGTGIWVEDHGWFTQDESGKIIFHEGIIRDVSERIKAENALFESNELNKSLMQSFPFDMDIVDEEGNILFLSKNLEEKFGRDALGTKCWKHYRDNKLQCADCPLFSGIKIGNTEITETKGVFGGRIYEVSHTGMWFQGKKAVLEVFQDITDHKLAESELLAAKVKAEESDRLKSSFLANMSHEIRTPMNGILGFMGLLQEPNLSGDERDEYIKIVKASGSRLLGTINDIIDISKIESGQSVISISETDINNIMQQFYRFFRIEAEEKGLILNISELLPENNSKVLTDGYKVESVLSNLIKNALKFTPHGSIGFGCYVDSDMLRFTVSDTGVGIPPKRKKHIFERFVQAETSLSRPFEGSGLGLSISKAYVEMLGGEIHVKSELGKGSEFSFTIPFQPEAKEQPAKAEQPDSHIVSIESTKVILVAEDDDISFYFLKKVLANEKIRLLRAPDGMEAVRLCRVVPEISLVLMDIKMPLLDGYEATKQILGFKPDLPIVALTAYAFAEDSNKAIASGCVDYLSKPLNREKLFKVLAKHLATTEPGEIR